MSVAFSDLPVETYYHIGFNLSYEELLGICTVSKDFAALCANPLFWKYKSIHNFNITPNVYANISEGITDDREIYIKLAGLRNIPIPGAERYGHIERLIHNALIARKYQLFWKFYDMHSCVKVFMIAGENGMGHLIDLAVEKYPIDKSTILHYALCGAAKGGHNELIYHLLEIGTDKINGVFAATTYAAISGNLSTVKLLLDKNPPEYMESVIQQTLYQAAKAGYRNIVQHMLTPNDTQYNNVLLGAAEGGQQEIIDWMLSLGATDYSGALTSAARGGHMSSSRQMIELGADNLDEALLIAAGSGNIELVKYLVDQGADIDDANNIIWDAVGNATERGHVAVVKYLIGNLDHSRINFSGVVPLPLSVENLDIIRYLFSYIPPNQYDMYLWGAAKRGFLDIVQFFVEQGATDFQRALESSRDQPNIQYYINSLLH